MIYVLFSPRNLGKIYLSLAPVGLLSLAAGPESDMCIARTPSPRGVPLFFLLLAFFTRVWFRGRKRKKKT